MDLYKKKLLTSTAFYELTHSKYAVVENKAAFIRILSLTPVRQEHTIEMGYEQHFSLLGNSPTVEQQLGPVTSNM